MWVAVPKFIMPTLKHVVAVMLGLSSDTEEKPRTVARAEKTLTTSASRELVQRRANPESVAGLQIITSPQLTHIHLNAVVSMLVLPLTPTMKSVGTIAARAKQTRPTMHVDASMIRASSCQPGQTRMIAVRVSSPMTESIAKRRHVRKLVLSLRPAGITVAREPMSMECVRVSRQAISLRMAPPSGRSKEGWVRIAVHSRSQMVNAPFCSKGSRCQTSRMRGVCATPGAKTVAIGVVA